jgi:hypothetical protein
MILREVFDLVYKRTGSPCSEIYALQVVMFYELVYWLALQYHTSPTFEFKGFLGFGIGGILFGSWKCTQINHMCIMSDRQMDGRTDGRKERDRERQTCTSKCSDRELVS